jgi:hypothetical protein
MGHVECPQSEPANNDLQPSRAWMVTATDSKRVGINRETVGRYLRLGNRAISIVSPIPSPVWGSADVPGLRKR